MQKHLLQLIAFFYQQIGYLYCNINLVFLLNYKYYIYLET